jgi:hypothetical protein
MRVRNLKSLTKQNLNPEGAKGALFTHKLKVNPIIFSQSSGKVSFKSYSLDIFVVLTATSLYHLIVMKTIWKYIYCFIHLLVYCSWPCYVYLISRIVYTTLSAYFLSWPLDVIVYCLVFQPLDGLDGGRSAHKAIQHLSRFEFFRESQV